MIRYLFQLQLKYSSGFLISQADIRDKRLYLTSSCLMKGKTSVDPVIPTCDGLPFVFSCLIQDSIGLISRSNDLKVRFAGYSFMLEYISMLRFFV